MHLNDSEWEIMDILWRQKDISFKEIRDLILKKGINWAPNTIHTLLSRLEKKSVVQIRKDHTPHLYNALLSRKECETDAITHFIEKVFDGSAETMLASLVKSKKIKREDLLKLDEYVDSLPE